MATKADERRLIEVLRGGAWGIGSPHTEELAAKFARYTGAKFALPVSTGTAALELAVKALGIGPGDEVIVPAYTFVATATCVLEVGATVVFADIDPQTINIAPADVARLITRRTRAVIPVHFGGNPCDMAFLTKIVRGRDIAVIEDAAHAHGMFYRGRHAGTVGACGCFSFQSSKNMTAGEGGMFITNDKRLYELTKSYHSFGRLPGHSWYGHHTISWNHRISAFQSAVLLGQLERLEPQTARRSANGAFLNKSLAQIAGQRPQSDGDAGLNTRRSYHLYIWRCDLEALGVSKMTFAEALRAEGVRAGGGYEIPLQENALFQQRRFWHAHRFGGGRRLPGEPDYARVRTPVTKAVCADAMWIGQSDLLASHKDMQGIVDAVAKVVENVAELRARERRRRREAR
jgi:dTDP-4-amino-4,6-dideoxygalactose transaminase